MDIEIKLASVNDKTVLRNLLELYLHDFSEYDGADVNEHGLFGYNYLDNYWTEQGRYPFLIKVSGRIAGFVLVRLIDQEIPVYSIAEFFVLRKYRRQGIGREAAHQIFDMFPSTWNAAQEKDNHPAQSFWRKVISEYTGGDYEETQSDSEVWIGPIQKFESRGEAANNRNQIVPQS